MAVGKIIHTSGKRKSSIARATLREGKGVIRINSFRLETFGNKIARMRILQPLKLAAPYVDLNKLDIKVNVRGGGIMSQADAIASSIARALAEWITNPGYLESVLTYDRTLIAGDYRQTEVHKPSQSSKGPRHKRQKSYR